MVKKSYEFATRFSNLERELEQREEKEATLIFKICSKCGKRKPAYQFSKDRRNTLLGGRTNTCKACQVTEYMNYYREHKSEISARDKIYRDGHKGSRDRYHKNWQKNHKEYLKEKAQEWYQENKERIKARNLQYYGDHKEACQVRRKLWLERNKEKIREYNKNYRQKHNK